MHKTRVLRFLQATGAFAPFRYAHRRQALVLMYHRFSPGEDGPALPARAFREQLAYLKTHYHIVPLSYLAALLNAGRPVPPRTAVLTIDDAYRDAYTVAFPLLRAWRIPATLFVVSRFADGTSWLWTDKVRYLVRKAPADAVQAAVVETAARSAAFTGRSSPAALAADVNEALKTLDDRLKDDTIAQIAGRLGVRIPETPPEPFASITWKEAREMNRAGIEFGSHTASHPILTNVDPERLERELVESRASIEHQLQERVSLFCYPNGSLDAAVRQAVRRAGYTCAVSSDPGFNDHRTDVFALRRISTEGDLPRFVQSTSGFEQVKLSVRRRVFSSSAAPTPAARRPSAPQAADPQACPHETAATSDSD